MITPLPFGANYRLVDIGDVVMVAKEQPLVLESGVEVRAIPLAYKTYGTLSPARDNAILVCHGLTADQYMAQPHPVTAKPGWWDDYVGPGKPIDTEKYFVICSNVIGGCMGSFGPKTTNPATGQPYGLQFPVITIGDMAAAQALLLDALGIDTLFCIVGASMGGMIVLDWLSKRPKRVRSALCIAAAAKHSAQNIAFHEIGRQAIMADPDWQDGDYLAKGSYPAKGLAVARMAAHVTYLSDYAMQQKFGRALQDREQVSYGFEADFKVESYLRRQGQSFVERFDANSYLYITRAMDYFDLAAAHGGQLARAFPSAAPRVCVVSFSSDWLFPTTASRELVRAMTAAGVRVSFAEVESDKGHDAFLLDEPDFKSILRGFLSGADAQGGPA